MAEGYRILHVSSHGPGEEGKDVVAENRRGDLYCFQLKGGDIRLSDWRKIREEVEELVAIPVSIAGISSKRKRWPVLVTNGRVRGDAQKSISEFGAKWKKTYGGAQLGVWAEGTLLPLFLKHRTSFLPNRLLPFRTFVELYVADFAEILPVGTLAELLERITTEDDTRKRPDAIRAIFGASLTAGYIISQYELAGNHVAACQGWTVLAATILRVAERENIPEEDYGPPLVLVREALARNLGLLANETVERKDFILPYGGPAETFVYGTRVALIAGWLAAAGLLGDRLSIDASGSIKNVLRREFPFLRLGGEGDWAPVLLLVLFIERIATTSEAEILLSAWVKRILNSNRGEESKGLPSPYWSRQKVLERQHGLLTPGEDEDFQGQSYTLHSCLDMLVRRLCRQSIASVWPEACQLEHTEFRPEERWHWLLWRNHGSGKQITALPQLPKSWGTWRDDVFNVDVSHVPDLLSVHSEWLAPFALTFPHRVTPALTSLIDDKLGSRYCVRPNRSVRGETTENDG